ncbi:MAG: LicD family protein [Bacteroidales bacterium]|nr:LicD family protein [Bacteroidales bacterium]
MLDILTEIDKICQKHNIRYWLIYGTVLGAVRHGGFIPWDDDLDIGVMRKDYRKLCKILKKELPENLVFQDASTEKYYPCSFAKVRDKQSIIVDPLWNSKIKEKGLYIDIFQFEKGFGWLKKILDFFYINIFMRKQHHIKSGNFIRIIANFCWYPFLAVLGFARFFLQIIPSKYIILSYGASYYKPIKRQDLFPLKSILFEGKTFFAPGNIDSYLKTIYGDYMQIPPESKREIHSTSIEFL